MSCSRQIEPTWRDPKLRGPLYPFYQKPHMEGEECDLMEKLDEDATDLIDSIRYKREGKAFRTLESLQSYTKVNDLFGILVDYRMMMDYVDRDYRDEVPIPDTLEQTKTKWVKDTKELQKELEVDKNGIQLSVSKYQLDIQKGDTVENNKKALLERKKVEEEEFYIHKNDIIEGLKAVVKPLDEQRVLMKEFISDSFKEAYGPVIDLVHSTLYHRLVVWLEDLYVPPYEIDDK
ncbi:uncharacterized protein LOC110248646 [Exaiptasia diaphana]|uniref:Uncharacterized protein n=1 Tax=Exaiptasia diaphana TaxID=2652724 RepID=A0A913XV98_EXADI|nr:uncharacterized protein LOC110248646 [Exaiptasia diaphana]